MVMITIERKHIGRKFSVRNSRCNYHSLIKCSRNLYSNNYTNNGSSNSRNKKDCLL